MDEVSTLLRLCTVQLSNEEVQHRLLVSAELLPLLLVDSVALLQESRDLGRHLASLLRSPIVSC